MAQKKIHNLTQEDYKNATDIFRKFRTIESVASALHTSVYTAKRLIQKGYPAKGWHSIAIVLNEEKTIEMLKNNGDKTEREKSNDNYKKLISYYEAHLAGSMKLDANGKPTATPNMSIGDFKKMYDMKKDLLTDEIDNAGYISPFESWTDKEIKDFVTGKRRPK